MSSIKSTPNKQIRTYAKHLLDLTSHKVLLLCGINGESICDVILDCHPSLDCNLSLSKLRGQTQHRRCNDSREQHQCWLQRRKKTKAGDWMRWFDDCNWEGCFDEPLGGVLGGEPLRVRAITTIALPSLSQRFVSSFID